MTRITENAIEQIALEWLENPGYEIAFDGQAPDEENTEDDL